jgi:hypothetical protein
MIYLVFGSPEEPLLVPEDTIVGVHFAEDSDEDVDFIDEDFTTDNKPNTIDRESLEALERLLDGDDGQNNLNP